MQQPTHQERSTWTFSQLRPEPTASGRRIKDAVQGDLVSILRFYGTTRTAIIDQEQLRTLEPKQWLSNELCTFLCYEVGNSYLEGGPGRSRDLVVLHCVTWDYGSWQQGVKKLRVPGAPHALEHKYIAFPGNETNTHFFLCIIVNASDLLLDRNPSGPVRTTAIILNSLQHMPPTNPEQTVKGIIACLADSRMLRSAELDTITVHQPLVAQQPNGTDCGLYPGHYLSVFLTSPEAYEAHCTGRTPMSGSVDTIWKHNLIQYTRQRLKSLILESAEIRQGSLDFNTDIPPPVI